MTESDKIHLEETHILIESEPFKNVLYAIDRKTKDMCICYGEGYKNELPILANQVRAFAVELLEVWEHIK
jgi:hypothetical protein